MTCDTKANAKAKPKAKAKKQAERVTKKAKTQVTRAKVKKVTKTQAKPKAKAKSYADRVDDVVRAAEGVANRQAKGPKMFKMRNRIRGEK